VVGRTVTLELKPEQTETLARARQSGTLSLALRSIADVNIVESKVEDQTRKRSDSVNVIRYGVSTPTTTQK
jgi:pilus assembly protein CpaB